ncbi:hypothetical protein CARUB_v10006190mg [Capsella rubella]|uniref:F-box domain-containing protein n=2 Tax=Capsella rubella TaxID=81985 RepID=R0F849_9BRAS|nr:hypothetical protein CARUB_v10006190mg [Capsella rubella]
MSSSVAKEEKSPISSLPDSMAVSYLARVSRSDHLALSLVSKKHRSLVNSSELYKTRSLMGLTEACLYICLSIKPDTTPRGFILRRAAQRRLIPIPIPLNPSQPPVFSSFVVLDWGIYVIGGFTKDTRTSDVWLLDCRTNTWRHAPSMGVARLLPAAGVVGGKIYVFGGCDDLDCSNWAEVFDPVTQSWDTLLPLPDRNESDNLIGEALVMEDKLYAGTFFYSPSDSTWGRRTRPETLRYCCVIEGMLYGCDSLGNLVWRESEELEWNQVKGLEALRMNFSSRVSRRSSLFEKRVSKLSNFGVNIVVFWVGPRWDVWCAEISLERRKEEGEVWGTIKWSEAVITVEHAPFARVEVEVLYAASVNV